MISVSDRRTRIKGACLASILLVLFLIAAFGVSRDPARVLVQGGFVALPLLLFLTIVFVFLRCMKATGCQAKPRLSRLLFASFATLPLSFALATVHIFIITYGALATGAVSPSMLLGGMFAGSNFLRAVILLPFAAFLVFSVFYPMRDLLDFLVAHRWPIAGGVFLLLFLCCVNISNVGMFDAYVQPTQGGDLVRALLGVSRGIRSDEWLVNLPSLVSTEYAGYGEINDLLRGTENYNLPASSLQLGYSMLSNPLNLGYYLFGARYGAAFFWSGTLILSVMLAFEFGYILSKKKPLIGLLSVALIGLSPFSMWWSVCALMNGWLAIFVCAYYVLRATRYRTRAIFMVALAFSGAYFVCRFYPAWQVPMGYLLLAAFAWLLIDNRAALRAFRWYDWVTGVLCIVFMASIILAHLWDIRAYTREVMATVYPGSRFETGGFALDKPMAFIQTLLLPFREISVGSNNSEASTFFSLFPLPILLSVYSLVRQCIARFSDRTKKIDFFALILLIPTVFLLIYTTVGIPAWMSKITLMSFVPAPRAADWLAFANTVLLIRYVASGDAYRLPMLPIALLAGATVANSVFRADRMCPGYMTPLYVVLAAVAAVALAMAVFGAMTARRERTAVLATVSILLVLLGFSVNPINSGLDALTNKPVAKEIQRITAEDPDSKWIGYGGLIVGQFAVANGAPCVSSVNYVPNMELWTLLDPEGKYNEIYNRYAHIAMTFTEEETSFSLISPDYIAVNLSYRDIRLTEAKYLFSLAPLEEGSDEIDLRPIYTENAYIYEIVYLK